ncbi:hypothetical protein [Streptomyces sp. NPDC046887]|uniref:hypothetical protein n=1 Tax=Streptomyces sp. NPDC046887 TaxID=3155472 RepID=UPI00340CF102
MSGRSRPVPGEGRGLPASDEDLRRLLAGPGRLPPVPDGLLPLVVRRGARARRRARLLRLAGWLLLAAALAAFAIWAAVVQPWQIPPYETAPPLTGW